MLHRENPAIVLPTKMVSVHFPRQHKLQLKLLVKNEAVGDLDEGAIHEFFLK
jgi:hypothetical protein